MISKEIKKRSVFIRKQTPDILEECFEMQDHICDLCGQEIQCLVVASLDHSVPISYFSRSELSLEEANKQCNSRNNLRAAHSRCNIIKNGRPRELWFARGMDKLVGAAKIITPDEIHTLKLEMSERGRKGNSCLPFSARSKGGLTYNSEDRSRYGKLGGAIGGRVGNREGKRRCGLKAKENKTGIFAKDYDWSKGGRAGGNKTALIPNHMSKAGKLGGKLSGGSEAGRLRAASLGASGIGAHVAQHVNRGRIMRIVSIV